ncbi:suppressor of fused domain protein [Paenibacillus daejeonensis]|uniref:suppressor of fused domain protein n=1 Tax=Paenibacillus daejeonensis TaxID=135193 RepID=UPI00036BB392|nr:suppressor of fused domain protein [Paenibacillus daejeonensis]
MSEEEQAPGWDAIDEAMARIYGDQEPLHYASPLPMMLGGNDPLNGISAYRSEQPSPHWHLVTYGFSDLYEKEGNDPEYSGYGFELTMRLARQPEEDQPPAWAINMLQNMARYVFNSGNVFNSGDHLDANGPIMLDSDTKLTALAFITDPELGEINTPHGKVAFVQAVGITGDELQATQEWNTLGVLRVLAGTYPAYITDLERDSILNLPEAAQAIAEGSAREGSSTAFLYVDQLGWESSGGESDGGKLMLGAKQAAVVAKLLRARLLHGQPLSLVSGGLQVVLDTSDTPAVEQRESGVMFRLDRAGVEELGAKLVPVAGQVSLSALPQVVIEVMQTHIKDSDGNVVRTIG